MQTQEVIFIEGSRADAEPERGAEENVYNEEARAEFLRNDAVSAEEEAFMRGYEEQAEESL